MKKIFSMIFTCICIVSLSTSLAIGKEFTFRGSLLSSGPYTIYPLLHRASSFYLSGEYLADEGEVEPDQPMSFQFDSPLILDRGGDSDNYSQNPPSTPRWFDKQPQ